MASSVTKGIDCYQNGIKRYKWHRLFTKGQNCSGEGGQRKNSPPTRSVFLGGDKGCSFEPLGRNTVEAPSLLRRVFINGRNKASKAWGEKIESAQGMLGREKERSLFPSHHPRSHDFPISLFSRCFSTEEDSPEDRAKLP